MICGKCVMLTMNLCLVRCSCHSLTMQVKQDIATVQNIAGNVTKKLTGIASKFMSDLGRGY
jgi:hypothetical protein